jgi:predicted ATPase/class 3 adenylate cyclase
MEIAGYTVQDLLHQTSRTSVYRATSRAGDRVVIKTPTPDNPSPRDIARYQWAFDLAADADPRAVVRHLELVRHGASVALVMHDSGGVPLSTLLDQAVPPLSRWLELGTALATALGRLHAGSIVHKDINPHNVLMQPGSAEVQLFDLGISMRLRRETVDTQALDLIEGTLAYMSPEQCGRIKGAVDHRSDLYSLGVTLFELATGQLPFRHDNAAELAHAHVARPTPPLREQRPEFPEVIEDIVQRLMAKNADDRYASAQGLAHDLGRCLSDLRRSGTVRRFTLGQLDASSSFRVPDRLYGREDEQARLLDAIAQASRGARVLVTVAGLSGVGKTALVQWVQHQVAAQRGTVCSGKFEQFGTTLPYHAVLQALRALLKRELAMPQEQLVGRRDELQDALGVHGQLLTSLLPELQSLVGPQPEVEVVSPRDAERRLHLLIGRFLGVFATTEQPMLLFLDDLQWADAPSLNLLEALAGDARLAHLVVVAGYRSNEVGLGHPLHKALDALRASATTRFDLPLAALQLGDVTQLIAHTLHTDLTNVQSLAAHIHGVSSGNPFFVGEFLYALRERGFFRYSEEEHAWTWDLARLHEYKLPDNVAALVSDRLAGLPSDCLDLLDTASCVGSEFDLRTLASVHLQGLNATALQLVPAVRSGVVVPLDAHYKVFESLPSWALSEQAAADLDTARYRFQHDRVRQTVHERQDSRQLAERHLRIGRLLMRSLPASALEQRVVEVFSHVVFGVHLLDDRSERDQLARVGLMAGVRAQACLAFETASQMLEAAAGLLSATAWDDDYDTAIGIHLGLAHCAFARSLGNEFETHSELVIQRARTVVHRAEGHNLRIRVRHVLNRLHEAIDIGIDVAASLGVRLPRKPGMLHVLWGVVRALAAQRGRDPLGFARLGEAPEPEIRAAVALLGSIASPAYFAEPNLLPLIGMMCSRLAIRHGMTPQSPYGFGVWALVLCGVLGHIDNGYRYGLLALEVGRRYGGVDEARASYLVDTFVKHWKEPLASVAGLLHADWARNRDSGDTEMATYAAGVMLYTHFLAGGTLDIEARYGEPIHYLEGSEQRQVKDCFLAWVELHAALRSASLPEELEGRWFSYPRLLAGLDTSQNAVQIALSSIAAGVLDMLAGRLDRAELRFALAAQREDNLVSQALVPGLAFLRALNGYWRVAAGLAGKSALRMARRQRSRLKRWARYAPVNLAHRVSLLDAEDELLRGRPEKACMHLHTAIEQAAGGGVLYRALAQQRLAAILQSRGARQSGAAAAQLAADSWAEWGATCLARQVQVSSKLARPTSSATTSTRDQTHLEGIDLQSVFSALASISSEIDEPTLLDRLMPVLMQAAGADRGLLLLHDAQGQLWIEAQATLTASAGGRRPLAGFDAISHRAVDLALRAAQPVVVHDAATAELLAGEAHAAASGVAALLTMAITLRGHNIGVLYFENHLARGAFTPRRVEVTHALGVQAGIALANARLYGQVQAALQTQTQLTHANKRFVPGEFLSGLGVTSIVDVQLNHAVERDMNVLFVDLRNFTALSRELGARATVAMINRYLSHVQPGIATHGGFVAQYYGDGVLALFPNDADNAVFGAVAMCRGLDGYNRDRGTEFPELQFGMGLHSGTVTLGTIGDPDHFQCSVVGDSVNLASRMEGLTKHFGATLVLSAAVEQRLRLGSRHVLRPLGRVQVVGRVEVIEVFECLASYPESIQGALAASLPTWMQALQAYQAGQWAQAAADFSACLQACSQDKVAARFLSRCHEGARSALSWDGIERPAKG